MSGASSLCVFPLSSLYRVVTWPLSLPKLTQVSSVSTPNMAPHQGKSSNPRYTLCEIYIFTLNINTVCRIDHNASIFTAELLGIFNASCIIRGKNI